MGQVVVVNHMTLDGVIQGPGAAEEDTRDGFTHGGWAVERSDEVAAAKFGQWFGGGSSFLFGRVSYDGMLAAWNERGGPFKDGLNGTQKFVASRNADADLPWPNSTLLRGDVAAAVEELKRTHDGNLVIFGSSQLIGTLLAAGLIDVFQLLIHPIVLGTGRRMFPDGVLATFELVDSLTSPTGVIAAAYATRG